MAASNRQARLNVAEDWKKIYQSFRNADFQSYDFDNLRRTMINYLRQNYPEDFNDYIESSEYLALIDMIAFLGQNLSFRIDLNARENLLDTAERRESILRLAKMLAYNPHRNQAANGLLRIETVRTTETIRDSNGLNLSGLSVRWNDQTNRNFFEQFVKILNSALPSTAAIGNPLKSASISGVQTQKYRFNATNTESPVFPFTKNIEGVRTRFEVVSVDIQGTNLVEEPPVRGASPSFLFRDDGQGLASTNTGFFMHFRQGKLDSSTFAIDNPVPNQIVAINTANINDTDVWLYNTDDSGFETIPWTKLDTTSGNNIIYNSLFEGIKNVYAVSTRADDKINLSFSDGVFGNLPSGNFKVYFRTSANASFSVSPKSIGTVNIDIPYQSTRGTLETLTLGLKLNYTVTNASSSESNDSIRLNAPATYYTQNRLITGEDYNIGTLALSQEIIKSRSVNRISSGVSKYFDLADPSGKYSNTSLFADDGILYTQEYETQNRFSFDTQSDIEGIIYSLVEPVIASNTVKNFYLSKFPRENVSESGMKWQQVSTELNRHTGFLVDETSDSLALGKFTTGILRLVEAGTKLKFIPPEGSHFANNEIVQGQANEFGSKNYIWTEVLDVRDSGQNVVDGTGPVITSDVIPHGAVLDQIVPKLSRVLSDDVRIQLIDRVFAYRDFGIRYDVIDREWKIITADNLNTQDSFSIANSGDNTGRNIDSSWLIRFKTDGSTYTMTHRNVRYIFESAQEIRFFFDSADQKYDPKSGRVIRDKVKILSVNRDTRTNAAYLQDFDWTIVDGYKDTQGYIDNRRIQVQFFDSNRNGVADDPDMFSEVVSSDDLIFYKKTVAVDGSEEYVFYASAPDSDIFVMEKESDIAPYTRWKNNQVFYLRSVGVFKRLNTDTNSLTLDTNYIAFNGRANLKFQYIHVANSNHRIDPSASNLIDTYLLTRAYDREMREYAKGNRAQVPLPPSSDELYRAYNAAVSRIKSISDDLIYHPVRYKILFGESAEPSLQVSFKIVRNTDVVINENELRANIIELINEYFDIENWDFGDTFYFQELSAFIMNRLSPKLTSILIVPKQDNQAFGSLFEIKSDVDEIFISSAKVEDVEIIDEITASKIKASGNVVTTVNTAGTNRVTSSGNSLEIGGGLNN